MTAGAALPSALSFLIFFFVMFGRINGEAPMLRVWGPTLFSQNSRLLGDSLNLQVAVGPQ